MTAQNYGSSPLFHKWTASAPARLLTVSPAAGSGRSRRPLLTSFSLQRIINVDCGLPVSAGWLRSIFDANRNESRFLALVEAVISLCTRETGFAGFGTVLG